jgi:hypothetical protein
MKHDQQDPALRSRLTLLVPLLLLSVAVLFVIAYCQQQQVYQWEQMLQQDWQPPVDPITLPAGEQEMQVEAPDMATAIEDTPESNTIAISDETAPPPSEPESPAINSTSAHPQAKSPAEKPRPEKVRPEKPKSEKPTVKDASKPTTKSTVKTSGKPLKLKLPDNPYQGEPAVWDNKKPAPLPDLFAAEKREQSRLQLGGRLITDEKKLKDPNATFLDTVEGAEINISVSTP